MFKKLTSKLRAGVNSVFYKNVFYTIFGTGLAQVLPILITPLLASIYAPEHFSVLANLSALVFFLGKTFSLSIYQTIILPRSNFKGLGLLLLQVAVAIFIALVVAIVGGASDIRIFDFNNIFGYASFSIFFFISCNALESWHTRFSRFRMIAISRVIRSIATATLSLLLFYVMSDWKGLAYGLIFGYFFQALYLTFFFLKSDSRFLAKWEARISINQAVRYKSYLTYNTLAYLFNNGTVYAPVYFIGTYYGNVYLGAYYLGIRLIQSPLGLISDAYSRVLIQRLTRIPKDMMIKEMSRHFMLFIFIGVSIVFCYNLFGDLLLNSLFGSEWEQAKELAGVIVYYSVIQLVFTIYCLPFKVLEWNNTYFVWELIRFLIIILVLVIYLGEPINSYLSYYGIGITLSYVLLPVSFYIFILRSLKKQ